MDPKKKQGALGLLVIAILVNAYLYWGYDQRTPAWLRDILRKEPWLAENALCREHGRCKFSDADFWSPENTSLTPEILSTFFTAISPPFQGRLETSLAALHKRYLARADAAGVQPQLGLLQIGPNKLNEGEVFALGALNAAAGGSARAVLVEPLEPIIPELTANALKAGLGSERTTVINAAMCPSADENLTLWKFKDGFSSNPWYMEMVRMWSSLGGKDVLLNTYFRNVLTSNLNRAEFPKDDDAENWIVPVPVQCHTPATLLREVGMAATDVAFIFLDCEGYDGEILSQFTELPGFDPVFIIMEFGFHHASRGKLHLVTAVANHWSARGYAVYKDNDNLVFFKTKD